MSECLNRCEFLLFKNCNFNCVFYKSKLDVILDVNNSIKVMRCIDCEKDKDSSQISTVNKLKIHIKWLKESLKDFKEDIEKIQQILDKL